MQLQSVPSYARLLSSLSVYLTPPPSFALSNHYIQQMQEAGKDTLVNRLPLFPNKSDDGDIHCKAISPGWRTVSLVIPSTPSRGQHRYRAWELIHIRIRSELGS